MEDDGLLKRHDFAPRHPDAEIHNDKPWTNDADSDTTATGSSDEFNWDEGEEKQRKADVKARRGRLLYVAFMKLARPIRALLVGIIGSGLLITPFLVVHFQFNDNPIRTQVFVWSIWLAVTWSAGCVTYLFVDMLPRLIIFLVSSCGGHVERLKIQIELAVAVSGWLKLALDISWCWVALAVIRAIYQPPQAYWSTLNRVLQAFFGSGIILLIEKLGLHLIAINFHQKALAERLAENQLALKALDRLSNAQPAAKKHGGKRGHKSNGSSMDLNHIAGASTPVTPPPTSKNLRKERTRRRKAMSSIFVDQVRQIALKNSDFNRAGEFGDLHSARRLARKLFLSLNNVYPPREHLVVDDFLPYFHSTTEAHDAFAVFDKDGNGDITKKEMREAVQRIYRERKSLVASLKDASSAMRKLDGVMLAVAFCAMLFLFLLIFNRENTLASLVPLGTIILGFSFIFGNAAATLFESLIFIFSTHVFDVGDLVMIDDQVLFVREFGLFATTFRRVDGQEIVAPNALLANTKTVHNLRRSNSMWETTTLMISYNTPLEILDTLKSRIKQYVLENNREWSGFDLNIDKMEYQNAIHVVVAMEHRPNWQDWGGRWARRTAFMKNLRTVLEELDIRYTMPIQPVIMPSSAPSRGRQHMGMPVPTIGTPPGFGGFSR